MKNFTVIFCITCLFSVYSLADTIHVPSEQPTIQAGIDAADNGDTVLVADGIYTGEFNKNLDYNIKAINVMSENGADVTIIDCENDGRGFYFHSGEGKSSIVEGFTIMNGNSLAGAGIYCFNSSPKIKSCIFLYNIAEDGGGIRLKSHADPRIENCIFCGNSGTGGAILCYNYSSPEIVNCTVYQNTDYGIYCWDDSSPKIKNCIIRNNSPEEIFIESGNPSVEYSNIKGGWPGDGNIDEDPLFVDPENNDFHLQNWSLCIDRGTDEDAPEFDFEGESRFDHPYMPNDPSIWDMGADEYVFLWPVMPMISCEDPYAKKGEYLTFNMKVTNITQEYQIFKGWLDLYLIGGEPYKKNPVRGPVNITLGPGEFMEMDYSCYILMIMPLGGAYTLCLVVGESLETIWDKHCFEFFVLPQQ